MSRSFLIALLVVMILLFGLPLVMMPAASHCAACPDADVAMFLWGCVAVLVAVVGVVSGPRLRNLVRWRPPQHEVPIVDRLDRPPHAA